MQSAMGVCVGLHVGEVWMMESCRVGGEVSRCKLGGGMRRRGRCGMLPTVLDV